MKNERILREITQNSRVGYITVDYAIWKLDHFYYYENLHYASECANDFIFELFNVNNQKFKDFKDVIK